MSEAYNYLDHITAYSSCANACEHCASACLSEGNAGHSGIIAASSYAVIAPTCAV